MDPQQRRNLIAKVEAEVQNRTDSQREAHGFDHVLRVRNTARWIQRRTGGDPTIIDLAALLHDIGDAKFNDGNERSGSLSQEILARYDAPQQWIEHIVHIVDNLSYRKRETAEPLSLEGQIVQDADRLDALGAIGIVRAIEFGAARGRAFYSSDSSHPPTTWDHFSDKLLRLPELMNTEVGRKLASDREPLMREFLTQFESQWNGFEG